MSVYKYFPIEAAHRFLSTWALRITPPDQFNDPFEMCPPIQIITEKEIFSPDTLKEELALRLARDLVKGGKQDRVASPFATKFCACLLRTLGAKDERRFLNKYPQLKLQLPAFRRHFELILAQARAQVPMFTERFESTVHQSMRDMIGALCMSLNGCHPLVGALCTRASRPRHRIRQGRALL